jgi:hypothetical protein
VIVAQLVRNPLPGYPLFAALDDNLHLLEKRLPAVQGVLRGVLALPICLALPATGLAGPLQERKLSPTLPAIFFQPRIVALAVLTEIVPSRPQKNTSNFLEGYAKINSYGTVALALPAPPANPFDLSLGELSLSGVFSHMDNFITVDAYMLGVYYCPGGAS